MFAVEMSIFIMIKLTIQLTEIVNSEKNYPVSGRIIVNTGVLLKYLKLISL